MSNRFSGDHVLLAPPFIMEEHLLNELVDKPGRASDDALADTRRDAARRSSYE